MGLGKVETWFRDRMNAIGVSGADIIRIAGIDYGCFMRWLGGTYSYTDENIIKVTAALETLEKNHNGKK